MNLNLNPNANEWIDGYAKTKVGRVQQS